MKIWYSYKLLRISVCGFVNILILLWLKYIIIKYNYNVFSFLFFGVNCVYIFKS